MARLTDPGRGLDPDEAEAFYARASGPHTVQWRASSYRWQGGVEVRLYDSLPIVGGTLTLDSSDPIRRRLTLEVASDEHGNLIPTEPNDPLSAFGQYLKLWVRIDKNDGTWFDWLKQGEYAIRTTTSEWPSLVTTVECADYSSVVDSYLHEKKRSFGHMTIQGAVTELVQDALPDRTFFIHSSNDAKKTKVVAHTIAEAGTSRWETVQSICAARGHEAFFQYNGNLVIRHDRTNDDADSIPGTGPDTGSLSHPAAVIRDGEGGNLVTLTSSVTREGAVNGVFLTVHETVSQRIRTDKKNEDATGTKAADPDDVLAAGGFDDPADAPEPDPDDVLIGGAGTPYPADDEDKPDPEVPKVPNPKAGDKRVSVQVKALATGSIKWGDRFGRQNLVEEHNVKVINNSIISKQKRRAKRLLHRRGGVIRSVDMEVVGGWWVEPDDRIRLQYMGKTEAHFVTSCVFDIAGQEPTQIRCRALNVIDPG